MGSDGERVTEQLGESNLPIVELFGIPWCQQGWIQP